MSAIQQLPKPEQLVDIVSHAAAVKLAMDGEFDAKISELKKATAALAEQNAIAQTLAQVKKLKSETDEYVATALSKAKDALSRAQDATDKAASREALVAGREQAVASREAGADQRQATQDTRESSFLSAQTAATEALKQKESTLLKAGEALLAAQKKLIADQAAFNQRLDSLRV